MTGRTKRRVAAFTACALALSMASAGLATASNKPSAKQLRKLGSSPRAARTVPKRGLHATLGQEPLIVVSFVNGKATVIGGSAVPSSIKRARTAANIPVSAVSCNVNFTTQKTSIGGGKTSARWFGGIGCNRTVQLTGQAFLAESATKFDGKGNFYNAQSQSAKSGQSNTIINAANPSLYVWHATNIYFPEKPANGVIVVQPDANQSINAATACKVVTSSSLGVGVHCDVYSNRF
jgi:hypothetical protein